MNLLTASRPATLSRLKAEFVLFYLIAPLLIALVLPPTMMFVALFTLTAVGLALLNGTEGFEWRELLGGVDQLYFVELLAFAGGMLILCLAVVYTAAPDAAFLLLKTEPGLMLAIAVFYPVASALPQEVVFRPLYFRRYGTFLPGGRAGLLLNAALFSLAHLMYWSWVVALMTFAGGVIFAWAYEVRRSFVLAVVLHSLAGIVIFAVGLGIYFYSGNVQRPF
ncbi:CPBP family intramembrane glutamic endopeptidase [Thalassobius sp. MITS945101]|uniref:CPBP family intramembrane glutamic endopeptidase n=1 Tax=Thalassobius sp. MITS945101 TaxID=3096994 RepID=UPI00399B6721